jgi:hypothetical protein
VNAIEQKALDPQVVHKRASLNGSALIENMVIIIYIIIIELVFQLESNHLELRDCNVSALI